MKLEQNNKYILAIVMIVMAAGMRLIPHWPNFTPIAAMALFGGAYLNDKRLAYVVPFAAMLLSDLVIGMHDTMWAVYLGFAMIVSMGFFLRKNNSVLKTAGVALGSSILFFVVTNFAMWASGTYYTMDLTGLIQCYVAAIPFFGYSAAGDLFYTGLMFGVFEYAKVKILAPVEA
jgi:hypothetical protein